MDQSIINAYLQGTLQGKELQQFKTELANNPQLQKQVQVFSAIKAKSDQETKSLDTDLDAFFEKEESVNARKAQLAQLLDRQQLREAKVILFYKRTSTWLAAASIAILVLAITFFMQPKAPTIAAFKPYKIESEFQSTATDDLSKGYNNIINAFEQKQYALVIEQSTNLIKDYPFDVEYVPHLRLIKGETHKILGQNQAAIDVLTQLPFPVDQQSPSYLFEAKIQEAVAHYRLKNKTEALIIFRKIKAIAPPEVIEQFQLEEWLDFLE